MNSWSIKGGAGRLRSGSRLAARLGAWTADRRDDGRFRITAQPEATDPYWLEHGRSLRATLAVGRGQVAGPAELVDYGLGRPLVFDLAIEGI